MVKLTPGFKIDPREMDGLSRSFSAASRAYRDSLPQVIAIPRGGGVGIDRAMATTLKTINEMHTVLCEAMNLHGRKLYTAATNYRAVEAQTVDTITQVNKLVSLGDSVSRAESVVVAEYLGGRPPYMAPGPTQTVSIYGQKEGQAPDGKPVLAKIPDATKISPRRPWVQFQYQIIDFDYHGLWRLVDDLNSFIRKGDPLVVQLAKRVADFCSPYRNYGDAVYQFNATFTQDVSLASGFHKVVSTIAATIDYFANVMAEKEAWLEQYAHECQIPDSLLAQLTKGRSKEQILQYFRDAVGKTGANQNFALFVAACVKVLRQAEDLRRRTAGQLVMLAETITSGGLDYYTKKDTHPGSADPGGLFNDGSSQHPAITKQLESELADDGKRLKDSPTDVKATLDGISKVGGYGGQIGGLMGSIESVRKSKSLFETTKNVGSLAGAIGPVLETLGLLVFAE